MGTESALGSGYHVSKYSLTYELGSVYSMSVSTHWGASTM